MPKKIEELKRKFESFEPYIDNRTKELMEKYGIDKNGNLLIEEREGI